MNHSINKFRLALSATMLLGAALAPSYAFAAEAKESATVGQAITDTAISTKLRAKLLADDRIVKSDVDVNTTNGIVTLTGNASTLAVRSAAESIARQEEGVIKVDNKLVIATEPSVGDKVAASADAAGNKVEHAAATTGEAVSDSFITSKVKSQLLAAKGVSSANISVETVDGVVTLSGHVPRKSEMTKAISIAKNTKGVKRVVSTNLEIAANG